MNTTPFRCHDADACAMGQNACPTPSICGCAAPACAVKDGTHKPAEALHQQIAEPQPEALRLADALTIPECTLEHDDCMKAGQLLRAQHARIAELEKAESDLINQRDHCEEIIDRMADAVLGKDRHEWTSAYDFMDAAAEVEDRIAELESQLDAIGAGGVEPLRKPAVQAAVPDGFVRVPVEKINQAIHRATVFDDGGDGADAESARSVVAILREAMSAPAHPAEGGSADFEAWWEKAGDGRSKMMAKRAWHAALAAQAKQGGA